MKTTALIFSFALFASAGFSSCSQLRGTGGKAPLADGTELVDYEASVELEEFKESPIEENGDDAHHQRELEPFRIRITVKNTQTYLMKVKAICRDSSNSIRETSKVKTIQRNKKGTAEITNNNCAKVEVKFWLHNGLWWDPLGQDSSGSDIVLTEHSENEEARLLLLEDDIEYDGFVIEPNSGQSVINNSKFCFRIVSVNLNHASALVKYRKDYDACDIIQLGLYWGPV